MHIKAGDNLVIEHINGWERVFEVKAVDHHLACASGFINTKGFYTKASMNLITGVVIDWAGLYMGKYVPQLELPIEPTNECDCGGYKTYNSWQRACHSGWCKVNMGVKHG